MTENPRKYLEIASEDLLSSLVFNNSNKFKMIISNVNDVISTLDGKSRMNPDPRVEIPKIYPGKTCTLEDIYDFRVKMNTLLGDRTLTNEIVHFFSLSKTDYEFMDFLLSIFNRKETVKFLRLLYFFVFNFSCNISLVCKNSYVDAWAIEHENDKKKEFSEIPGEEKILYHGTESKSVYSILRKSLRNLSGTELMSNGEIFGSGIYLTDNINTAIIYSKGTNKYIFVVRAKRLNKQSTDVYVQQENDIQICGLLYSKYDLSKYDISITQRINEFTKYKPIENSFEIDLKSLEETNLNSEVKSHKLTLKMYNSNEISVIPERMIKRIKAELEEMKKEESVLSYNFFIEDDMKSPLLVKLKISDDTELKRQCDQHGIDGILISITFSEKNGAYYPYQPPFVRVVSPILEVSTGRVNPGGAICSEILYINGWSPAMKISKLCTSLANIISCESQEISRNERPHQGGLLDLSRLGEEYLYETALSGHHNISVIHKW